MARGAVALFVIVLVATLGLAGGAAAHIRYSGSCDPYGYCEYFNGNTVEPGDHSRVKDFINVVYYPNGSWDPNVKYYVFEWQMGWYATNGSDQDHYRLLGSPSGTYWGWRIQTGQRAEYSDGARWHSRAFLGHTHSSAYDNWSASGVHHDPVDHSQGPDRSWQESEEYVRERLAVTFGRETVANWTYLPRADSCSQGWCYNGWPARVNSN